jgi:hypothetical protein
MNTELQRKRLQKKYRKLIRPSIKLIKKPYGYHIDHIVPFCFLVDIFNDWNKYKYNELFLEWHNTIAELKPIPKYDNLKKSVQARRSNGYGLTFDEINELKIRYYKVWEKICEDMK